LFVRRELPGYLTLSFRNPPICGRDLWRLAARIRRGKTLWAAAKTGLVGATGGHSEANLMRRILMVTRVPILKSLRIRSDSGAAGPLRTVVPPAANIEPLPR
jgi:hypothetical protein